MTATHQNPERLHQANDTDGMRFQGAIEALQEAFILFDADDKLVVFNQEYKRLNPSIADILVPGISYEKILRTYINTGVVKVALGREEEYIQERLQLHRHPKGTMIRELTNGTWQQMNERTTPEGGTVLVSSDITELKRTQAELQISHDALEIGIEQRTSELRRQITERKFVEQSLRQSEERMRDVLESTPDWMWEMNADLRYTYLSEGIYCPNNLTPKDVVGKTRPEVAKEQNWIFDSILWQSHLDCMKNRKPFQKIEFSVKDRNGKERFIQFDGKPIFNENGSFGGYRGASRDISAQKIVEQKLRAAKLAADKANRAKSEFLTSMSHELRTPLNSIMGFSQLMLLDPKNSLHPKHQEYMDTVYHSGAHLLALIDDVLDLSKIEAGKVEITAEHISVKGLIEECSILIANMAKARDITIIDRIADLNDDHVIFTDHTRFRQILVNFASNAIKYNAMGGTVTFELMQLDSNTIRIAVSDTGPGIPKEKFDRLFQPFDRLGAENSGIDGNGIGLTISKKLVELMDGEIGVESTEGVGSTFWVDFQSGSLRDCTPKQSSLASNSLPTIKKKFSMLYVEDNRENREFVQDLLTDHFDLNLFTASSGESGLEMAIQCHPKLILLDINLPGMDGYEVIQKLKANVDTSDIPVLALTANAMPWEVEKGLKAGFHDYLKKPICVENLISSINSALEAA
jgi:PAS domain S-box-containing protein